MWRMTLKGAWAHRRRMISTSLAVVLGVAFLSGTLVLSDTLRAGVGLAFADVNAGIDAVVRGDSAFGSDLAGQRTLVDASVVGDVRGVEGVETAVAEIEGLAQVVGADGQAIGGYGAPTRGVSWTDDAAFRGYALVEGTAPQSSGEVAIDVGAAEIGGLDIGDSTIVRTPAPVNVTVVGLLELTSSSEAGATVTAFHFADAQQHLLGGREAVTRILVAAVEGVSQVDLVDRITAVLPDGNEAITGQALTDETLAEFGTDFLNLVETFLLVFAAIALLVATFSIYNTFSITVAQRTRESALLRALGASRRQVLASTVLEAVLVGAVASILGLVLGIGLSAGSQPLLGNVGVEMGSGSLMVERVTIVMCFVVGVGVTLVASVVPAFRASRVAPLAALREVAIDRSDTSRSRAIVGCVLTTAGVALALVATTAADAAIAQAGIAALLVCTGAVVLGPVAARPVSAAFGGVIGRLRGITGFLAGRNAMRNPRRTANTASALMVGVGVVTLFTVVGASVSATTDDAVSRTFGGDLAVMATGFSGSGISPQLVDDLTALPTVEHAVGLGLGAALVDGEEKVFTVADPHGLTGMLGLDVTDGSIGDLGMDGIAVAKASAADEGWELGTTVAVTFADGASESLTVAALYDGGPGDTVGSILMPTALWEAHAIQPTLTRVLVDLSEGVETEVGRQAVEVAAAAYGAPDVLDRDAYTEAAAGDVDQLLAIVYGLLALAIVIALMGIANTLSLSVHERIREIGLLRAVGQTRRQLRTMIRWESVIVALFGTGTGLGLGTFLGWVFIRAIAAEEGLGVFAAPLGQLAVVLLLGAIAGVLAAVRPARRATRLDVLTAIAAE